MKSVNHLHAVRLVETYLCGREYGMIMVPAADRNLAEYLEDTASISLPDPYIPQWFGCLVSGLAYLHERNIIHHDIKPHNILCHGGNILFADFGISRTFEGDTLTISTNPSGTTRYWAPEVGKGQRAGRRSDVFSLGTIFLEMIAVISRQTIEQLNISRGGSYSENLRKVLPWMKELCLDPGYLDDYWYPPVKFLCSEMLKKRRDDRPYANVLRACWEHSPSLVMPPTLCECIVQALDLLEAENHGLGMSHDVEQHAKGLIRGVVSSRNKTPIMGEHEWSMTQWIWPHQDQAVSSSSWNIDIMFNAGAEVNAPSDSGE